MPNHRLENSSRLDLAPDPQAAADSVSVPRWFFERSQGVQESGTVLLHAPSAAFQAPGGGENQLLRTAWHLDAQGVPVRPFSPWSDRLEGARLLHLFGMSQEGLELARIANARRVPVVLSPICWFEPRAIAALATNRLQRAGDLARWGLRRLVPGLPGWRRELLRRANAILPNSRAEADQLVRLFSADRGKIRVVPNGVEPRFALADPAPFRSVCPHEDFVLYVGRIEPRKNVLNLVRAIRKLPIPLVVIGDVVPGHEAYETACRREGGDRVSWLARLDHDDPRLSAAYAAARVFALPSWFETPGLAALEAALAACAIVITPYGCTREYFENNAAYVDPGNPWEIARGMAQAWERGGSTGLAENVLARYLWSDVARRTAEVYDEVAP
ncbi:glycosyltransferase [soil metagenome]